MWKFARLGQVLNVYWLMSILTMALYIAPYILLGDQFPYLVHDNLDSVYIWYKVLIESGGLYQSNDFIIQQILNGIPRAVFPSELSVFVWLYQICGPLGAYVINRILMAVIGFIGMYLLLKKHIVPGKDLNIVYFGVAICYALLPFWPFGGMSVAGIPLVVYAFLNIRQYDYRFINWIILIIFPFYSSLVLAGFFLLVVLSLIWAYDFFTRKANWVYFGALFLVSLLYVFVEYRLFLSFLFDSNFISHRTEFAALAQLQLSGAAKHFWRIFSEGQYHAPSLHNLLIYPLVLLSFIPILLFANKQAKRLFLIIFIGIFLTSILYGLLKWHLFREFIDPLFNIIPMNLGRFHFLHPLGWLLLFSLVLFFLVEKIQHKSIHYVVGALIGVQVIYVFSHHELFKNPTSPTVSAFYAVNQFEDIANYIGQPKSSYRVASVGIHPSIAQYNGFYTLDGYMANYPLAYKYKFREIIADELEKNERLKNIYDSSASRVYMYSHELYQIADKRLIRASLMNRAGNNTVINDFAINKKAFLDLGGKYVISAAHINETNNTGFVLEKVFYDSSSAWDIYLYKVEAN
jgi:hypothetical protein